MPRISLPKHQKKLTSVKTNFIKLRQLDGLTQEDFLKNRIDFSGLGGENPVGKNQDIQQMKLTAKKHLDNSISEYIVQCKKEKVKPVNIDEYTSSLDIPPYKWPDRLILLRKYIKRKQTEIDGLPEKFAEKEKEYKKKVAEYKRKLLKKEPVVRSDNPDLGRKTASEEETRERLQKQVNQALEEVERIRSEMSPMELMKSDLKDLKNQRTGLVPKRRTGKDKESQAVYQKRLAKAKKDNLEEHDRLTALINEKSAEIEQIEKQKKADERALREAQAAEVPGRVATVSSLSDLAKIELPGKLQDTFKQEHEEAQKTGLYDISSDLKATFNEIENYKTTAKNELKAEIQKLERLKKQHEDHLIALEKKYILNKRAIAQLQNDLDEELGL